MRSEFEARYKELRARGALGWAGENHQRSVRKDRQILDRLNGQRHLPSMGAHALELGCGNGALASWFSDNGFRYLGVDISKTAIDWAADHHLPSRGVRFCWGDARDLPNLKDCSVQLIFDSACFHCLIGADRDSALSEAFRILDPAGVFILSSMCGSPGELPDGVVFDRKRSLLIRNDTPYRSLMPFEDLVANLRCHGFDPVWSSVSVNSWWNHATLVSRKIDAIQPCTS